MNEISAASVAGFLAQMLTEGHRVPARADGDTVHLTEHGLQVVIDTPDPQPNGMVIRVPVGVVLPESGGIPAWDQAVGVGTADRHPAADAIDGWMHNTFPVFAASYIPGTDLMNRVAPFLMSNGTQTVDVYAGPLAIRDFGGMPDTVRDAAVDKPPTMRVVHTLLDGYAYPDRPIWAYTYCANMPSGPLTEVTVLNSDASDSMAHVSDHLSWGDGHGSIKSWALVKPATASS
ncbi:hypothetical protein [Actinomadura rupiterrae]|uniref:hypothetical protein n=1 Tax=Actinomadura rupiterrae TaxID=559627 RepID=UPI0020A4E906|nr:hypothetical protein [Actinomadura rupiterrae]MCP2335416.1 hypothetical protein [Actinomadura rupiterrae]